MKIRIFNFIVFTIGMVTIGVPASTLRAAPLAEEVAELRRQLALLQSDYADRLSALETRLQAAERRARQAERVAEDAVEMAEQAAIDGSAAASAPNTFNPSIGAVLTGRFADLDRGWDALPGFEPGGEIGTGGPGFALGEAELNLKANVDANFFGSLTVAVGEEDGEAEFGIEEAWLQTTSLSGGLSVTGGRFFSAAGYLNSFHVHADDFVDRPLPYQAFFGGRYTVDGLQARWVAPSSLLFEVGAEVNWGAGFPASHNGSTSPAAETVFVHVGGDAGLSNSWQLGLSTITADVIERGTDIAFTGDSDLAVADFVWKWAPQGNAAAQNLKIQAEYFRRREDGVAGTLPYAGTQTGWYLQAIWQFAPRWRIGGRYAEVRADGGAALAGTALEDPGRPSRRSSLMMDFSPSEYSRLRLQYSNDRVLPIADDQLFLQYIMSLGAHGAHQF